MSDFHEKAGAVIRQLRKPRTQKEAAPLLGVSFQYLGKVERGETPLSLEKACEWSRILGGVIILEDGEIRGYKNAGN